MATKYVDLEFLMSSTRNDVEQVKEFIQDVLELNAVSIASLHEHFESKNFIEMKGIAHMLKSSADIFNSTIYKEKLVALEAACKAGQENTIRTALEDINTTAKAWEEELRKEFANLA